jgi:XdhC Rossmann domain
VDKFWQQAPRIWANGEPAVLATVMAVHRQVPKVSPPGACLIVTPTKAVGRRDGRDVDSLFEVTLVDDTGCANPEWYPGVATIVHEYDPVEALLSLNLRPATFAVSMSVGHRLDMPAVQRLRTEPLRYLGMMGSRRRVAPCVETLSAAGFTKPEGAAVDPTICTWTLGISRMRVGS